MELFLEIDAHPGLAGLQTHLDNQGAVGALRRFDMTVSQELIYLGVDCLEHRWKYFCMIDLSSFMTISCSVIVETPVNPANFSNSLSRNSLPSGFMS